MDTGSNSGDNFLYKKAFEISYALFRLAAVVKNRALADQIEERGSKLLIAVAEGDYRNAGSVLTTVEYIIRLCSETGIIHPANGQLVINEARDLKSSFICQDRIVEIKGLENIFSKTDFKESGAKTDEAIGEAMNEANKAIDEAINAAMEKDSAATELKSLKNKEEKEAITEEESGNGTRQRIILGKISQTGSCRFGDILELLPDFSPRTLRYDLQTLIEKGLIEKTGTFGPTVCYRLKDNEISGLPAPIDIFESMPSWPA